MKMKTPLLAVLLGIPWTVGNAFTLDAVGYSGGTLDPKPYSVFVPCYGEVVFDSGTESTLVLTSAFEEKEGFGGEALRFDNADLIRIIFDGQAPATRTARDDAPTAKSSATLFTLGQVRLQNGASLATPVVGGMQGTPSVAATHAVPETASVVLGVMSCALLLRRRR
jgi:hypothetical protein